MTKAVQKITLSPSRDIPFEKLVLSQSNVRRIKAGVSVEELAEDIARRGLLQSLSVRPVLADDGTETGKFEIPAGGRRFQALSLLVKQKRLAKTTPIPCIVRDAASDILAEDDSLAENMQRVALHPLDQFRAFVALRDKGQSDAEIAAAFFVTPQIVKQRLKLASVAPALLEVYAEDGMTLEQLMAFTVTPAALMSGTAAPVVVERFATLADAIQGAFELAEDKGSDAAPQFLAILDCDQRLVLAGAASHGAAAWCHPVANALEARAVVTEAVQLRAQAGRAIDWHEPELAQRLRHRADLLDARLVDPLWRAFAARALQIAA